MTIRYTCDIFCDRCGNWAHGETKEGPVAGMATRTLKKAKCIGWSRDTKSPLLDLCPDCLKDERKSK